ncbi:uncharacterized protein LOC128202314 [Galleria mellonella]|uniref:Uncharacterized protein LOC128202314 n=1 Tax=Galleria mellonella TaxID=7137 RepID=A0ABM3N3I2_GALME|nr:uncharacterized protein LOC128202314 [Galleria mellonella]
MLEKCIWLQPRFVQAHVELLALKPESEKKSILTKLVELEPNNWEHFVLYGDWLRMKGLQSPASKYYLEALKLNFKNRNIDKPIRGDLIAFRYTVLMYRSLGQKSRILQLLTRWHTWRRGWPSAAAAHMYLRDWRLKMELEGRVQIYSKAVNPTKTTTCFDHSQLSGEVKKATEDKTNKYEENKNQLANLKRDDKKVLSADSDSNSACECKKCGTKKRNVSISSQIKTTHNKSEIGHKEKKCSLHRKDKTVKNSGVIPNIGGLSEHILMKTF